MKPLIIAYIIISALLCIFLWICLKAFCKYAANKNLPVDTEEIKECIKAVLLRQ